MNKCHRFSQEGLVLSLFIFFFAQIAYAQTGNWLELDGDNDYASIVDNSTLDIGNGSTEDFTIECFFYVPDLDGTPNQALIFKQNSYALILNTNTSSDDLIIFTIWHPTLSTNQLSEYIAISVGWHHVAAVFDNEHTTDFDAMKIFFDGDSLAGSTGSFEFTPGVNNSTNTLSIGANSGGIPFHGRIDELRISDNIRYSGATYSQPSYFPLDGNTRALWHFSEAVSSTSFSDTTANDNTLTGNNGAATLPVELTNFTSKVNGSHVLLSWTTATEVNNYGFNIERRNAALQLKEWKTIGFVQGSGTSYSLKEYSFFDKHLAPGRYLYRLKQIDTDGAFEYSESVEAAIRIMSEKFKLNKNYPNPFNASTIISFNSPKTSFVSLKVFDLIGKEVATIVFEELPAGNYSREWNAGGLPSGVYLYRLQADSFIETKKLILLK